MILSESSSTAMRCHDYCMADSDSKRQLHASDTATLTNSSEAHCRWMDVYSYSEPAAKFLSHASQQLTFGLACELAVGQHQSYHFGIAFWSILVGMFTGGTIWILTHGHMGV